jgi:hypothetical protein
MKISSRSRDFLWLGIALLPLMGLSFLFAVQPQDYWWLMRVGQDTIQSGAIPIIDTISSSRLGEPIVYQPWLAGVIFWLVYKTGGIALTFLLRGILIALAYGLIWWMVRETSNARLASALVVVLGLASANNWSVRSQLFAYPLFIICIWSLYRWQNGNNKYLWILPASTFLWVNLHGSFVLPLILAGAAIVFGTGERKPLLVTFGLMIVATLLNPRGFGVWGYFAFMLNSPSDQFFAFEWAPPRNLGWQNNIFFAWMLGFAPLAALSPRKLSKLEWIWFLGFGWLALTGLRYVIWFLFIVIVPTAALLSGWMNKTEEPKQTFPALNIAFGVIVLSLSLLFLPGLRQRWMGDSVPVYEMATTPLAATEWLARQPGLRGPLWTDYAFGGYLSFSLQSHRPWMDSRFNAFPPEQWTEYVQVSRAENWQEMFDREGINLLMLSRASQPKLIEAVSASELWCGEYRDQYAIIFSRCEPVE